MLMLRIKFHHQKLKVQESCYKLNIGGKRTMTLNGDMNNRNDIILFILAVLTYILLKPILEWLTR